MERPIRHLHIKELQGSLGHSFFISLFFIVAILFPSTGVAREARIDLSGFGTLEKPTTIPCGGKEACGIAVPNDKAFYSFARDLSSLLLPPIGTSANTLGEAGTSVQFLNTFSSLVGENHKDFALAFPNRKNPPKTFFVGTLMVRKGLPYSLEIGATASYAYRQGIYSIGLDFKYAFVEDFKWSPDIAVMIGAGTLFGVDGLNQVSGTATFLMSKPFGVGGSVVITPRAAFQLFFAAAGSGILNVNPSDPRQPISIKPPYLPYFSFGFNDVGAIVTTSAQETSVKFRKFPFYNRLAAGVDFNVWLLKFSCDMVYQFPNSIIQGTLGIGLTF